MAMDPPVFRYLLSLFLLLELTQFSHYAPPGMQSQYLRDLVRLGIEAAPLAHLVSSVMYHAEKDKGK